MHFFFILETIATQGTVQQISKPRPPNENIQPKQQTSRPLNILPSNAANIRPASSVSTQTIGAQTPVSIILIKKLTILLFAIVFYDSFFFLRH